MKSLKDPKRLKKESPNHFYSEVAFSHNHVPLLDKLQIDSSYGLEAVVVSENWVGNANVQDLKIPVILADHLIVKLNSSDSLQSTVKWLKTRKYLPQKGEHFETARHAATIGKWTVNWYEIQLLIRDAFFPL